MILLSYVKFLNAILGSIYLLYFGPAYGSRNVDLAIIGTFRAVLALTSDFLKVYAQEIITVLVPYYLEIVLQRHSLTLSQYQN